MSTTKLELDGFLPYQLNLLANVVSQGLSTIYAERYGFGIPEWRVIATLGQFETMTAKQIGAHSHMHKTKVSRAVGNLLRRRLVQKRANRQDLREAFLSLTREGRLIYDDLVPVAQRFAADLSEGFTSQEREQLDTLLRRLTDRSRRLLDNAPRPVAEEVGD
jgi:DNA-binding MarR family transcriptional regulator